MEGIMNEEKDLENNAEEDAVEEAETVEGPAECASRDEEMKIKTIKVACMYYWN